MILFSESLITKQTGISVNAMFFTESKADSLALWLR